MPINYPSNPSDGDTFTHGGVTYVYDATPGVWRGEFSVPTIPADVSDLTDTTSLLFDGAFSSLTATPTTIAGYGITDGGGGLGSNSSGPTHIGSGTNVSASTPGIYYFSCSGNVSTSMVQVAGATVSGMTVSRSSNAFSIGAGILPTPGNTMSLSVAKQQSSHSQGRGIGWVRISGSTTWSFSNGSSGGSIHVYRVE